MQKRVLLLCFLLCSFAYLFGNFKAKIITTDGKEHSGYLSELDYYDVENREPEDLYKMFLYDVERKRKSSFVKFDVSEIKSIYIYNKKDQKIQFVFVKPTLEQFESTKFHYRKYHKPKEKAEELSYENAWIPMVLVKEGKDLDLLCDFLWINFKVSQEDDTFITDYYNRYFVKEKESNVPKPLGFISKIKDNGYPLLLGGNNKLFEENTVEIFADYCPKMINDLQTKNFVFGNKILKVFDFYLLNCN